MGAQAGVAAVVELEHLVLVVAPHGVAAASRIRIARAAVAACTVACVPPSLVAAAVRPDLRVVAPFGAIVPVPSKIGTLVRAATVDRSGCARYMHLYPEYLRGR